jgi:hypothetical protein
MQHTAINLLKTPWAPSNSGKFIGSYIIPLGLYCSHCRRRSYLYSVNKADDCRSQSHGQEKIKLEEEAICKILVADTTFELGAEVSDVIED